MIPGTVLNLPVDVPQEYISLYGPLSPRLMSIQSSNADGTYGNGDIITIGLIYSAMIGVSGIPSISLNTGCHDTSCTTAEIQSFICKADRGKFAIQLEDQVLMNIDVNTTKEELKKLIERLDGIHMVTITYGDSDNHRTYSEADRVCSASGNNVTIQFNNVSFPQYNGDVPTLLLNATNTFADARSGLNVGEYDTLLQGVPFHRHEYTPILTQPLELVKGVKQRDGLAYYVSGHGTSTISFAFDVSNGDFTSKLEVNSLNFTNGYLYGYLTQSIISTAVPSDGSGARYMSPAASALGYNRHIAISSAQPQIINVTSPNKNAVYTQGDDVLVDIVFDLPVKVFGSEQFTLLLSTGAIDRNVPFARFISGGTTLEFLYIVQEGDTSIALDYVSSTSLQLNGGSIYKNTRTNETIANSTLPYPGGIGSLSVNKQLVINTLSPQIVSIQSISPADIYTAGDFIDFEVVYASKIRIEGTPRLLIKNNPAQISASIRTAPFSPMVTYASVKPGADTQVLLTLGFNWYLSPGDQISFQLPGFYVLDGPFSNSSSKHRTLHLVVDINGMDYSNDFSGTWDGSTETVSLTMQVGVPRDAILSIIIVGRSGLFNPLNGVFSQSLKVDLSVNSPNAVIPSVTKNYQITSITSIGFSSLQLSILPLNPGASVDQSSLMITFPEPLVGGDFIIVYLIPLTVNHHNQSFVDIIYGEYSLSWNSSSSELTIEVVTSPTQQSLTLPLSNYLQLQVPIGGLWDDSIQVSAHMQKNGDITLLPVPLTTPICSLSQPDTNILPTVKYLSYLPGHPSIVTFGWQNGPVPLAIRDSVVFRLPDSTYPIPGTYSVSSEIVSGPSKALFQVEITGPIVTLIAVESIPAFALISIELSQDAGIVIPSSGISPLIDLFTFLVKSVGCGMTSPYTLFFSDYVLAASGANLVLSTANSVLNLGSNVRIYLEFNVPLDLQAGDIFSFTLPGFTNRIILATPDIVTVTSNAGLSVTVDHPLQLGLLVQCTLTSTFIAASGKLSMVIDYSQEFYLPQSSISSDAFILSINAQSGKLQNYIINGPCVAFCTDIVAYSTYFSLQPVLISVQLAFSELLSPSTTLIFTMNGFTLSSLPQPPQCSLVVNGVSGTISSSISSSWNSINSTLAITLPRTIIAKLPFEITIVGFEYNTSPTASSSSSSSSDLFSVSTVNANIGTASTVLNYPSQVYPNYYFAISTMNFQNILKSTSADGSMSCDLQVSLQLPDTLSLQPNSFIDIKLPGFFIISGSIPTEDSFISQNLNSSSPHCLSLIDVTTGRSTISIVNRDSTLLHLYLQCELFGGDIAQITISNVQLPTQGISDHPIASGITYSIGLSAATQLITSNQFFHSVQGIFAVSDFTVDLEYYYDDIVANYSISSITIVFATGTVLQVNDVIHVIIPGIEISTLSSQVTLSTLSSTINCVVQWIKSSSTLMMTVQTNATTGGLQSIVVDTLHPYSMYIGTTGIPTNTQAQLSLFSNNYHSTAIATTFLSCFGICSAVVIPEVQKAGFATNYHVTMSFNVVNFSSADILTLALPGFSKSLSSSCWMLIVGYDQSSSLSQAFNLNVTMLFRSSSIEIQFADNVTITRIKELSFDIPESFGLLSPSLGIRSNYLFTVSWLAWSIGPSFVFSNTIGHVSPIGKIKSSSIIINPSTPGAVCDLSFSFILYDDLSTGDLIRIYLPSFQLPTYQISRIDASHGITIQGVNAVTDVLVNVDSSKYYMHHLTHLDVTLQSNILAGDELRFSIGNYSDIIIPIKGIYQSDSIPWVSIESSTSPIAVSPLKNYTRIGSFYPSQLAINDNGSSSSTTTVVVLDVMLTVNCPLFTQDAIIIHAINILPSLPMHLPSSITAIHTNYASNSSRLLFNAVWLSDSNDIQLTVIGGTYIMSGVIEVMITMNGYMVTNEIVYPNDIRNKVSLQSSICPFSATPFNESSPSLLIMSDLSFDLSPTVNQPTVLTLTFIPTVNLLFGDLLELRLPSFKISNQSHGLLSVTSSNDVFYDFGIIYNYSSIVSNGIMNNDDHDDDPLIVYLILRENLTAHNSQVQVQVLKDPSSCSVLIPSAGISADSNDIMLRLLRHWHMEMISNSSSLFKVYSTHRSSVVFQGIVNSVQPVFHFEKKSFMISNPYPNKVVPLTIEWSVSQSVSVSDQIVFYLPKFTCSLVNLFIVGSASEFFSATWNQGRSLLSFLALKNVPPYHELVARIDVSQYFTTPLNGIPQVGVTYYVYVIVNGVIRLQEELIDISVVPVVKTSSLTFFSSDEPDALSIAGDPYIIQLQPGHELTALDSGAQVIISNSFYNIDNVIDDLLYLVQPYNGTRIFLGEPSNITISTPPYRFADYYSGSDSERLIFRYQVRRDDQSSALTLFKPTTDYNTNNAHSTIDLNEGLLLRFSDRPAIAADLTIPSYTSDIHRSINSNVPTIIMLFTTSPKGVYSVGQQIDFQVQYSEKVAVGNSSFSKPELLLKIFPFGRITARYSSGTGTNTLVFVYNVSYIDKQGVVDSSIITTSPPIIQPLRVITGNQFNYIRRLADIPIIDAQVSFNLTDISFPSNLSLIGSAIKVSSIYIPQRIMGIHFSAGDDIIVRVQFTGDVSVLVNNNTNVPFILLQVGSNTSGKAVYTSPYNSSTLDFIYQVTLQDSLTEGLYLTCTCSDYFQRTFIQVDGSEIVSSADGQHKAVSVLLANSSAPSELRVDIQMQNLLAQSPSAVYLTIDQQIPYVLQVTSNLSANPTVAYSPGTVTLISIQFSKPVTVRGFLRLWLKAQSSPCPARFYSGNNTYVLNFVYIITKVSGVSTLDYMSPSALDTSMGSIYRYSDHPIILADTTLPRPGVTKSLGILSSNWIDTTTISPVAITSSRRISKNNTMKYPYFSSRSISLNLFPTSTVVNASHFEYISSVESEKLLPLSLIYDSFTISSVRDSWSEYSLQTLIFDESIWDISSNSIEKYLRLCITGSSQSSLSFIPNLHSLMSRQSNNFDSYWWNYLHIRNNVELSVKFLQPVAIHNAYFELNTAATTLNRAFSSDNAYTYYLTVQSQIPYDNNNNSNNNNNQLIGTEQSSYRLKYGGYSTRCISVTADSKSVYSIQNALNEVPALSALEPSVLLLSRRSFTTHILSYYQINFSQLPSSGQQLEAVTGDVLSTSCGVNAIDSRQLQLQRDNTTVEFIYNIKSSNAVLLKSKSQLLPGTYSLLIGSTNQIIVSDDGIAPQTMQLELYNPYGKYIAKTAVLNGTYVPLVRRSSLSFSSTIPGTTTAISLFFCFDPILHIGDVITVALNGFGEVSANTALPQAFLSITGDIKYSWNHLDSTLKLTILKVMDPTSPCISASISSTHGFHLPSHSVYQNSTYFFFSVAGENSTTTSNTEAVKFISMLPTTNFEYVSPVGIGSFAINFSDPRPSYPTALTLSFSFEVDSTVHSDLDLSALSYSTYLEIKLHGFYTADGYSSELQIDDDNAVHFTALWVNYSSSLMLIPNKNIQKGKYTVTILAKEEGSKSQLFFPTTGIYRTHPPVVSFVSDGWSSDNTDVLDIPYVYGHHDSFINVTLSDDHSAFDVMKFQFGVNFTRPIHGPATITIITPFLNSVLSHVSLLTTSSHDIVIWKNSEKSFTITRSSGWMEGFAFFELDDGMEGFSVNDKGVPLRKAREGISFSIIGSDGFLLLSNVSQVNPIPIVQHSALMLSTMGTDIFTTEPQVISIHLKLNLPPLPFDTFLFNVPGIQHLNSTTAVLSDACFSLDSPYNSNDEIKHTTLSIFVLNSTECFLNPQVEFNWTVREHKASSLQLRSVVQFYSNAFQVSWINSYRNTVHRKISDTQTLGITSSSVLFSHPYAGQMSRINIRLLTATILSMNDIIIIHIPGINSNRTENFKVADQYGRMWMTNTILSDQIQLIAPIKLQPTALHFELTEFILPIIGVEEKSITVTIAFAREGNSLVINPQAVKYVTPVGVIVELELFPFRSLLFKSASHNLDRVELIGFVIEIQTLSALNIGDVISIQLSNFDFDYDHELAIDSVNSNNLKVDVLATTKILQITILQEIGSTTIQQLTILPSTSITVASAPTRSSTILASISSVSNPVQRQSFQSIEVFTSNSQFRMYYNSSNSLNRYVEFELSFSFQNYIQVGSKVLVSLPNNGFENIESVVSLSTTNNSKWHASWSSTRPEYCSIELTAITDIASGHEVILIESNISNTISSSLLYENDKTLRYEILPIISNSTAYALEIANFVEFSGFGLKSAVLSYLNYQTSGRVDIAVSLEAITGSKFEVGDRFDITLEEFTLASSTLLLINTTSTGVSTHWDNQSMILEIHVLTASSSIEFSVGSFRLPVTGSNQFSSAPLLSYITKINGISYTYIKSPFQSYTPISSSVDVSINFENAIAGQSSTLLLTILGTLHLDTRDQFIIYLPQFWSTQSTLVLRSNNGNFTADWDDSAETINIYSWQLLDCISLEFQVDGLRLPLDGLSSSLAEFISFTSESSSRGGAINVGSLHVQLIGCIMSSSLLFHPARVDVLNSMNLSFTLSIPLDTDEDIVAYLPGFSMSSHPIVTSSSCYLPYVGTYRNITFDAAWNSYTYMLSVHPVTKGIAALESCTLIFNNAVRLPSRGIYPSTPIDDVQYTLSVPITDVSGLINPTSFMQLQHVGLNTVKVFYDSTLDASDAVSFRIEFQPSTSIAIGDYFTFELPLLQHINRTAYTHYSLELKGDQADSSFSTSFSAYINLATGELKLTAIRLEPSRMITVFVPKSNKLVFTNDPVKYSNITHYVSAYLQNIGMLNKRVVEVEFESIDLMAMQFTQFKLINCVDAMNIITGCSMSIEFEVYNDIDAGSMLLLSHPSLQHVSSSSLIDVSAELQLMGASASYFSAYWRDADAMESLTVISDQLMLIDGDDGDGSAVSAADIDWYSINMTIPYTIKRNDASIISTIPHIITVYALYKQSTGSYLTCGDSVEIVVKFNNPVSVVHPELLRILLNTDESAGYRGGNNSDTLHFVYDVATPVEVDELEVLGPGAIEWYFTPPSQVYALHSPITPANLTVPPPYGRLLLKDNQYSSIAVVSCNISAFIIQVAAYSKRFSIYATNDILDVQVLFNRPMSVIGTPLLLLSSEDKKSHVMQASYVNVSRVQWIQVPLEGLFSLVYEGEVTLCIDVGNMTEIHAAITSLSAINYSLPLIITPYMDEKKGMYKYQLEFFGLAPFALTSPSAFFTCGYSEVLAMVTMDSSVLDLAIFRYIIRSNDSANLVTYPTVTSLVLPTGTSISIAGSSSSAAVDVTLPMANSSESLVATSGIQIRTETPYVLSVYSNSTVSTPLQSGDLVYIIVNYSAPISITIDPSLIILELNISNTLPAAIQGENSVIRLPLLTFYENLLYFKYMVQMGDYAHYLSTSPSDRLIAPEGSILLSSLKPTTLASLLLPNGLLQASKVWIDATSLPIVLDVLTDHPSGLFKSGEDIFITVRFSAVIDVVEYIINLQEESKTGPYINLLSPVDGYMFYVAGSGSTDITFLYQVGVIEHNVAAMDVSNVSFHIDLKQGYFEDPFKRNFTSMSTDRIYTIDDITVSSTPAHVKRVDVTNANGTYYPGDILDVVVVFNEPVLLFVNSNSTAELMMMMPCLELFLPTQIGSNLLACYHGGNGTAIIHFQYIIPAPNFHYPEQPPMLLDYANAEALYRYLHGALFTDVSTHPITPANVFLPNKDHSYLTRHRLVYVDFVISKVTKVFAQSSDGVYTAGDVIIITVQFSTPVIVFYPPVLKLATGQRNNSAYYIKGNQTTMLWFKYTVLLGDSSMNRLLDYIDTRNAPYSFISYSQSFALNTVVQPSVRTIQDVVTEIFTEATIFGGVFMNTASSDASKLVAAYTALPLPGEVGSLSSSSAIKIDTSSPYVTMVTSPIKSGTYGHGIIIPIDLYYSAPVLIIGCPYLIIRINRIDKHASYVNGSGTAKLRFNYIVGADDAVIDFDYLDRFSLKLASCHEQAQLSTNTIFRLSENSQVYANLTLPWVRYVESVIAPVSIVGSGKLINIIALSHSGPRTVWTSVDNTRSYSLGDVIDINIRFEGHVIFPSTAHLIMSNGRLTYLASQLNSTLVTFPFVIQGNDITGSSSSNSTNSDGGLSYLDQFALITPSSCAIIDALASGCIPQNLPLPYSSLDQLSAKNITIGQSKGVVQSIYFTSSSPSSPLSSIYTGDIAEIIIEFSEPVVVEGAPVLHLFFSNSDGDNSGVDSQFIAFFDSNISPTKLVFKAYISSEQMVGRLYCGLYSTIDLNGGRILRQANFLPLLEVSLDLDNLCCEDNISCDKVSIKVLHKVPFITRVHSPQVGVYSIGEQIDIIIDFSDPVVVRGSPVISMDLVGQPIATYVDTSTDRYSLQFTYIVRASDYTSSFDYYDIHSLFINSNGHYDGIFLHCDTGIIPAHLQLPERGADGSLGHQTQIIINKDRPNLLKCSASPSKATSGDDVLIVLEYNEDMQVLDEMGQVFTSQQLSTDAQRSLGISLRLVPTEASAISQTRIASFLQTQGATVIFKYSVTGTDPTGSIILSSSIPIIAINTFIVSATTSTAGPAEFTPQLTQSILSSIDNNIPVVIQVYSSNVSSLYPFGVGDVLDIFIEMSLNVVVEQIPRLRLVLSNGRKAVASYASDNPPSVRILKFHYTIGEGDDANPLEYDGNDALEGVLLRFSTNQPTIVANLNLPDTYGLGSLAFCCNVIVDSTPPHVVSLIPLKRPGMYGENEIIYIMARFSKPVVVVGVPELYLTTQTITTTEVQLKPSEIGLANYTSSPDEYDIPIDIRSTDVFFRYDEYCTYTNCRQYSSFHLCNATTIVYL